MFFKKSESTVSKFKLSLEKKDILTDIRNFNEDPNKKDQLFSCIDDKPPHDPRISKIDDFMKSSLALKEAAENLQTQVDNVSRLQKKVKTDVKELFDNCSVYTSKQNC